MKLKEIREVDLWKLFNIKVSSKFLNISVDDKKKKKILPWFVHVKIFMYIHNSL
jgi:hypothetical protein